MGPAGLTAVFGMGTGVAPPVWSPGRRPRGGEPPGRGRSGGSAAGRTRGERGERPGEAWPGAVVSDRPMRIWRCRAIRQAPAGGPLVATHAWPVAGAAPCAWVAAAGRGGQAARLLGPVGCDPRGPCTPGLSTWSSPRSLHSKIADGSLVSEGASRLDAFSAYPVPTWLPGDAPSGTAGTPEVGPPQSSRTRGDAPQASHAHGR